jgi:hypothetical protein
MYSRTPETQRWAGLLGALAVRHSWLVAEMTLRGDGHYSPIPVAPDPERWRRRTIPISGTVWR